MFSYILNKAFYALLTLFGVVTVIFFLFNVLPGAVFVEYIFGWNGLGKEIVNALNTLDLSVIIGSVLVIALMFIIINIFVDIIYSWLDPKVKLKL